MFLASFTIKPNISTSSQLQIRLKPIFSSPCDALGSVPGHTKFSASTPTAASADSAKADQPGMKTTCFEVG